MFSLAFSSAKLNFVDKTKYRDVGEKINFSSLIWLTKIRSDLGSGSISLVFMNPAEKFEFHPGPIVRLPLMCSIFCLNVVICNKGGLFKIQ